MKPTWIRWFRTRTAVVVALMILSTAISIAAIAGSQPIPLDQAAEVLVGQLAKKLKKHDVKTMSVWEITGPGEGSTELGTWLETKVGETFQGKLPDTTLVERLELDGLLAEHELSGTGLFDSRTTVKPGKMIGAVVRVSGKIFEKNSNVLSITLEATSAETSERLAISTVEIDRASVEEHLLNTSSSRRPVALAGFAASPADTSGPVRFEVHGLQRRYNRKTVNVEVSFINLTDEVIYVGIQKGDFGRCELHLRNNRGGSFLPMGDGRGSGIHCVSKKSTRSDYTTLPPGEKSASLTFKANKDELIHGEEFGVRVFLAQWTEDGQVQHVLDVSDLTLEPED